MVEITFHVDKELNAIEMHAVGHAEYKKPEEGYDPVCAGISTLAFTLGQCLEFLGEEGGLLVKPQLTLDRGDVHIVAVPTETFYEQCLHSFFVIQVGMHILATNFPDNVSLTPFDTL